MVANISDVEKMEREKASKTSTTLTRKGVMMMKRGRQLDVNHNIKYFLLLIFYAHFSSNTVITVRDIF